MRKEKSMIDNILQFLYRINRPGYPVLKSVHW
jgi:hypothetical protein